MDGFKKLVKDMRDAQKKYYKFHGNATVKADLLARSKALESKVDKALLLETNPKLGL